MPEVLPELGALAAAGLLLLIAAALWVIQDLVRNSFGRLPVVGSWVSANIDNALNDARNAILAAAGSSWGAAKQMFRWIAAVVTNPVQWAITAFAQVYSFASRLRNVYLPDLETRVLTDAAGWFASAQSYALSLEQAVVAYAAGLVSSALATAHGWVSAAEVHAVELFDTARADVTNALVTAETDAGNALTRASTVLAADIRAAETFAASETAALATSTAAAVSTLAGELAAGITTAETIAKANTAALVGGVYTDLETWGDRAVADAWPDAAGELAALRGTLGADFPWLRDLIPALAGAGAAGLAGALIRSMATSQAVTRLANDCVVPQCRNLGGYSRDLADLLGVLSTASLLGWLVEAVADPAGWARDTDAVLGPIASGATTAARTLLGVG